MHFAFELVINEFHSQISDAARRALMMNNEHNGAKL